MTEAHETARAATDTGIRYTHCRGPNCREAFKSPQTLSCSDGLCWMCWNKAARWAALRGDIGDHAHRAYSPEWSVAIDQWLEAGAP